MATLLLGPSKASWKYFGKNDLYVPGDLGPRLNYSIKPCTINELPPSEWLAWKGRRCFTRPDDHI